ncbi:MAG: methyltransferase domain-containing protein [Acidobacteria bacterium]|nr:methyltransferase domain-containing protein [Acidobacteriota bacterium]
MGRLHPRAVACRVQNAALGTIERVRRFDARTCPCCGWHGLRFRSFAVLERMRTGAICPRCGSFERHRALASFYPHFFARRGIRPARVIHLAPEPCLGRIVAAQCELYETSAYGEASPANLRLDITCMDLPDDSCDALLLNHVLDCIPDDTPAIAEMYRVLRPGGLVLAVVTFEHGARTRAVPVASNSLYRVYGSEDLSEHFAPFDASSVNAAAHLSAAARHAMGIPEVVTVVALER